MIGLTFQETRVYKDAKEEGRQEEQLRIVRLFLNQKLGNISRPQMARVEKLLPEQMERLTIALLSFETKKDLKDWLDGR